MRHCAPAARLVLALLATSAGCGPLRQDTAEQRWQAAERLWRERDDAAHGAWRALDPQSAAGRRARDLLAHADALYRSGLGAFRAGDTARARQQFVAAAALAPVDPRHYLELARVYRDRGMPESAAKYYAKYLRAVPDAERGSAQTELDALEVGPTEVLEPPRPAPAVGAVVGPLWLALGAPLLAVLLLLVFRQRRDARGATLSELVAGNPELHPAIAYRLGSLRHELLKHRVAAASDALERLAAGESGAAERGFVRGRLSGLGAAWSEHVGAFTRELGHRLDLRRDPSFARAERAILAIERVLREPDTDGALGRLRAAHGRLLGFDAELRALQRQLVRTCLDEAFLRELVLQTFAEERVRHAAIDDLECRALGLPVHVEVLRSDLMLVLRNLLRNAVLAAARGEPPRLVRLVATVELEPTGQEMVCVAVQDSSAEPLSRAQIAESGLSSGLGLAAAAVQRYGGSLAIEPLAEPLRKQVCVRFARAYEEASVEG